MKTDHEPFGNSPEKIHKRVIEFCGEIYIVAVAVKLK